MAIVPRESESFVQDTPGRPSAKTRYRKEIRTRFDLVFDVDHEAVEAAERLDGLFPLVTNDRELSVKEVYTIYKRQAQVETRFSQLKTQFRVAPVYLRSAHRIVALLTVYYLALLTEALLERELREAMKAAAIDSLPIYPEEHECRAPTTCRVIDLFQNLQLHELRAAGRGAPQRFATELTELQRQILALLRVPLSDYQA